MKYLKDNDTIPVLDIKNAIYELCECSSNGKEIICAIDSVALMKRLKIKIE